MKKILFLSLLLSLFFACSKDGINSKTPTCIQQKVNEFKGIISCNQGSNVKQYEFQSKAVYVFDPGTSSNVKQYEFQSKAVYVFDPGTCGADMTSEVLDENCNTLGYLGGIMGNTKINGEDFGNAKYKKTLWKN